MVSSNKGRKFSVMLEMGIDGNMMFKDSEITGGLRKVYTESFVIRVSRKVYC
jgi:hypothetical protein